VIEIFEPELVSNGKRANLLPWVRLPSQWIEEYGLVQFRWEQGKGADLIAALMALAVIAHHADQETGSVRLTWDDICDCAYLSRGKLAAGIEILSGAKLIERGLGGRSRFQLSNFNPAFGWAMMPARGLYGRSGTVLAFRDFTLRARSELDAMKIYFLLASRRDRKTNTTLLSYEKISGYSGVHYNAIRRALSVLASHGLLHISTQPSDANLYGIANSYRLTHLEPRIHPGTTGRALLS
jgi:hypothetical protein